MFKLKEAVIGKSLGAGSHRHKMTTALFENNTIIEGRSGSGKTMTALTIAEMFLSAGSYVGVMGDAVDEYASLRKRDDYTSRLVVGKPMGSFLPSNPMAVKERIDEVFYHVKNTSNHSGLLIIDEAQVLLSCSVFCDELARLINQQQDKLQVVLLMQSTRDLLASDYASDLPALFQNVVTLLPANTGAISHDNPPKMVVSLAGPVRNRQKSLSIQGLSEKAFIEWAPLV